MSNRPAVIDSTHRSIVDWEVFYFADTGEKERFDADPVQDCGVLTDPVSRKRFRPAPDSPRIDRGGRTFFFRSDSTRALFEAAPDSFAIPRYGMLPMREKKEPEGDG